MKRKTFIMANKDIRFWIWLQMKLDRAWFLGLMDQKKVKKLHLQKQPEVHEAFLVKWKRWKTLEGFFHFDPTISNIFHLMEVQFAICYIKIGKIFSLNMILIEKCNLFEKFPAVSDQTQANRFFILVVCCIDVGELAFPSS